jgi:hypothetical protein
MEERSQRMDTSRLESLSDEYLITQMASGGYVVYAQRAISIIELDSTMRLDIIWKMNQMQEPAGAAQCE